MEQKDEEVTSSFKCATVRSQYSARYFFMPGKTGGRFPVKVCRNQIKFARLAYTTSMYEVTVSVPRCDEHLLEHVKLQTSAALAEMDGIATDYEDKHRCYFSAACSDTFRFQLQRLIVDSVSETVALGYKNIHMRNLLKVKRGNFFQNVLINTMCVFDKTYDKQIVAKVLDADKPMFIDGYCNFKLNVLKRKWTEIAKLVSENNFILHDKQLILDFLQYLLDSVSSKTSSLSLSLEGEDFLLYDSKNNILPKVTSMAKTSNVEEEAALNVLLLKPKHITVYYGAKPSEDFYKLMQLFDCNFVVAN